MRTTAITRNATPVMVKDVETPGYFDGPYYVEPVKADKGSFMTIRPVTTEDMKSFEQGFITTEDVKFYDNIMDIPVLHGTEIIDNEDPENRKTFRVIRIMDRSKQGFKIYFGRKVKDG